MAEIWSNVKTVPATEVPGYPCDMIFLFCDTASDWSDGSGVVVKGYSEVSPS